MPSPAAHEGVDRRDLASFEREACAFNWSNWKLDDVISDFKRVDRVYRSLTASLK